MGTDMRTAIDYAGLVGKYIRMERQTTPEEREDHQDDQMTVGQAGTVAYVKDILSTRTNDPDCPVGTHLGVIVVMDYGMGYVVMHTDVGWEFTVMSPEYHQTEEEIRKERPSGSALSDLPSTGY